MTSAAIPSASGAPSYRFRTLYWSTNFFDSSCFRHLRSILVVLFRARRTREDRPSERIVRLLAERGRGLRVRHRDVAPRRLGVGDREQPHGFPLDVDLRDLDLPLRQLEVEDPALGERVDDEVPMDRDDLAHEIGGLEPDAADRHDGVLRGPDSVGRRGQRHQREGIALQAGRGLGRASAGRLRDDGRGKDEGEHQNDDRVGTAHEASWGRLRFGRSSIENVEPGPLAPSARSCQAQPTAGRRRQSRRPPGILPQMTQLREWLISLCEADSTTGREDAMLPALEAILRGLGATVERQPVAAGPHQRARDLGRARSVLFSTHLDTVPPFIAPRLEGGRVLRPRAPATRRARSWPSSPRSRSFAAAGESRLAWLGVVGEETDSDGARAALAFRGPLPVAARPHQRRADREPRRDRPARLGAPAPPLPRPGGALRDPRARAFGGLAAARLAAAAARAAAPDRPRARPRGVEPRSAARR